MLLALLVLLRVGVSVGLCLRLRGGVSAPADSETMGTAGFCALVLFCLGALSLSWSILFGGTFLGLFGSCKRRRGETQPAGAPVYTALSLDNGQSTHCPLPTVRCPLSSAHCPPIIRTYPQSSTHWPVPSASLVH